MRKAHTFTFSFTFLGFIFSVLFCNCAPIAEKGSFQSPSINVSNSTPPKQNPDGNKEPDNKNDPKDNKPDESETEDDNTNDEKQSDDNNKPKGPEFTGKESEEAGPTPITRDLY